MASSIQIPVDAPFTAEQRAWLDNFLNHALSSLKSTPEIGPIIPVTILFGTQTGTSESLSKKLFKTLKKGNFSPEIANMSDFDTSRLSQIKNLLVITSTYGDGEPPDSALSFHSWILSEAAPALPSLNYSILALGDSNYPDFCKCGIEFDNRFAALGAKRIVERVDVDVDPEAPYDTWSKAVIAALSPNAGTLSAPIAESDDEETSGYSKSRPFPSNVLKNFNLNRGGDKQTNHLELSLKGSGLSYQVGDALVVYPANDPKIVDELISHLPFKPSDVPSTKGEDISLREALLYHYDIGVVNKALIEKWQAKSGSPYLRSLVQAQDKAAFETFCWGRDLIDLVIDYPADFSDAEEFVSVLKKLQPRLYSIASSPKAHQDEVHLCVGIVRYQSFGRPRGGVCSTFLADRVDSKTTPKVYLHENNAFRLPSDPAQDVIMVGPGTGIAPFRAFLEERKATDAQGRNWLFFGNPHQASDFLYQDEIEAFQKDGTLNQLSLAWSRDQKEKIYVQHLMLQQGEMLWHWLNNGASFYVCGDASRMAKDVDQALLSIIQTHGNLSSEQAAEYVSQLKKDKRYQRDVY